LHGEALAAAAAAHAADVAARAGVFAAEKDALSQQLAAAQADHARVRAGARLLRSQASRARQTWWGLGCAWAKPRAAHGRVPGCAAPQVAADFAALRDVQAADSQQASSRAAELGSQLAEREAALNVARTQAEELRQSLAAAQEGAAALERQLSEVSASIQCVCQNILQCMRSR
jgi:hypothetical protein